MSNTPSSPRVPRGVRDGRINARSPTRWRGDVAARVVDEGQRRTVRPPRVVHIGRGETRRSARPSAWVRAAVDADYARPSVGGGSRRVSVTVVLGQLPLLR